MEQTYYLIIVVALLIEYLLSITSSVLDIKNIKSSLPSGFEEVYDNEKYAKSQAYLKAKTRFGMATGTFSLFLILFVIHTSLFGTLDQFLRGHFNNEIFLGLIFFGIIFIVQDIVSLPFSIYSTFVIEEKFGFNRTKVDTFIIDKLKGYALAVTLGTIIMSPVLYFFINFGENGWWIAWAIITGFIIAIQPLFVHVIAPMFNKFEPLEEGKLRDAIERYSEKVNFPIGRIDVMDGSKRSAHSNAYFSGFGKSRRIALFDTLLEKHTTDEIISVVAHEVGHYKKKHIITGTLMGIIETGIILFLFNLIMNDQALFLVFGVSNVSVHCGLVFFTMLYSPISLVTSLFTTALSRKNEFEADMYSLETTGNSTALINMLKGLAANNLTHLTPHPFKVFLSYSHPPVIDRISAIEAV
ncbi:MAG: peptidase M48 [Candidatus Marinimicrobia bacterium]|nr:peptidase M48 [Candidatus Neomarinimicrobiota bacterium]|tara:strand:+ start:749 stop:1984 length:1236 start_codon:yes stop_codon:yes gene_type:complete